MYIYFCILSMHIVPIHPACSSFLAVMNLYTCCVLRTLGYFVIIVPSGFTGEGKFLWPEAMVRFSLLNIHVCHESGTIFNMLLIYLTSTQSYLIKKIPHGLGSIALASLLLSKLRLLLTGTVSVVQAALKS